MKAKLVVLMLALTALTVVPVALAKEAPSKVTISGGDLPGEIEITGEGDALQALGTMYLEDHGTRTRTEPEGLSGDGYLITRFMDDSMTEGMQFIPFDQVRFYSHPDGYSSGYIYYIGMVEGASEYDGLWFRATREGQAALENVLAFPEAEASSASEVEPLDIFEAFFRAMAQFLSTY